MLPIHCGSHADYQNFVLTNLRKYYPNPDSIARSTWDIIDRFWNLDLSFTDWAAQLKINHLYAILSGFELGNTPGVGTFYDFFSRVWDLDDNHLSPHIHSPKTKVTKPKTKGAKADSIDKGLIDISNLALAGDGNPVVTSHRERKHRVCNCKEKGINDCKCDRFFSQPDCDIGWDSSRDCWYHGYDLYMNVDSKSDLPIFPLLHPASKHDSHGFLHNFFRLKSFLPDFKITKLLLDSAHDAMPYYLYCKRANITPFIDLNNKRGKPPVYKDDFTIDKDGGPLCPSGCRMRRDGSEQAKGRHKFKCSKISYKGGCISCTCDKPCSDAKYGRTVHLVMKDNPRLFNEPPRSSKEWKIEYNARTSAERFNKREKLDFKLEDSRHRSTKMWYCRLYHILMLQHLDAWDMPNESALRKLILQEA